MDYRSVVGAALIGGLGTLVLMLLCGREVADSPLPQTLVLGLGGFLAIFVSLFVGRSRGLAVLWALLLVFWLMGLYGALATGRGVIVDAGKYLPPRFVFWSFLGLPLAIATEFFLGRRMPQALRPSVVAVVFALWLGLVLVSWQLASRPLDVGSHPLHDPTVAWAMTVMLTPTPLIFSWWFAKRAWIANSVETGSGGRRADRA